MSSNNMDLRDKVYNHKTKNKHGFVQSEIDELLKEFPDVDMGRFNDALRGNT